MTTGAQEAGWESLQSDSQRPRYLRLYLDELAAQGIAEPAFYDALPRSLARQHALNCIYAISRGVFAHIYTIADSNNMRYVVVEPHRYTPVDHLRHPLEVRLLQLLAAPPASPLPEPPDALLRAAIDSACSLTTEPGGWLDRLLGRRGKLRVSPEELEALHYVTPRDKLRHGLIQPMLDDPYVEDIRCNGVGPLFVVHKLFGSLITSVQIGSNEELDRYVIALSEKVGRAVTMRSPIVDASLVGGSRINMVFGSQTSRRGSNFSVRRLSDRPLSIFDLVESGTVSYMILAYISYLMAEKRNFFVAGEAASGKTTLLNALSSFLPQSDRLITIEDTPEFRLAHENWVAETATVGRSEGVGVTMFDLLKAALRQRPDAILVGEIRGEEALVVFQAMQTGHPCMSTIHAASVENVLLRLTGYPIGVPREELSNLHAVIVLRSVRLPDGTTVRRVVSISEVYGYDTESSRYVHREVFRWVPHADRFEFAGSSPLLERLLAENLGLADAAGAVRDQMTFRAQWLEQIHARGVRDFQEVFHELA